MANIAAATPKATVEVINTKGRGSAVSVWLACWVHGCCLQRKLSIWNQPLINVVGDGCHGTFLTLNLVDGANTLV